MQLKNKIHWGGVLLVAGTCIGAGMIGVPVKTGIAGVYPSLAAFIGFWLISTWCGLLLLELAMSYKGEINFISMVKQNLGVVHKNIAWVVYLLFMYSIISGYTAGGAGMLQQWLQPLFPINMYVAIALFLLPFALVIYLGGKWVDFTNRVLTILLIISFVLLSISAIFGSKLSNGLQHKMLWWGDLSAIWIALPVLSATFSYHIIIPSLKTYLQGKISYLKQAIWLGGLIPLLVYIAWQLSILVLIPVEGSNGLVSMLHSGKNPSDSIINYLSQNIMGNSILIFISVFLFCALTSSLIGAVWALFDFLADGLKITKDSYGKLKLSILSFLPPIIYTIAYPGGFLKAVGYAGAFSAILTIIYPALMVWRLRYNKQIANDQLIISGGYQAPLGKLKILIVMLFGVAIVLLELLNNIK